MSDRPDPDDDEAGDRRTANIILLVAAVAIIGAMIWLVDALLVARKADECMGRRNCTPVEVPRGR